MVEQRKGGTVLRENIFGSIVWRADPTLRDGADMGQSALVTVMVMRDNHLRNIVWFADSKLKAKNITSSMYFSMLKDVGQRYHDNPDLWFNLPNS